MRRFIVNEPVFRTETLFVLGCDFEKFRAIAKTKGRDVGEYIGQTGQMFTFNDDKGVAIHKEPIWRCVWASSLRPRVVLHEIFHLITRICQDKGIGIKAHLDNGECGDETAAYLFEFYSSEVLKRLGLS